MKFSVIGSRKGYPEIPSFILGKNARFFISERTPTNTLNWMAKAASEGLESARKSCEDIQKQLADGKTLHSTTLARANQLEGFQGRYAQVMARIAELKAKVKNGGAKAVLLFLALGGLVKFGMGAFSNSNRQT